MPRLYLIHVRLKNYIRQLVNNKILRAKTNYITQDQLKQIIEAIPRLKIRKWKDEDVQMILKVCYWSALRISEAIRLKAEDFDLDRTEIYLGQTKTNKEDYATIPRLFIPELANYLKGKEGPLLKDLEYNTVYKWIIKLGKMLDIAAFTTNQSITGEKTKTHIFRKSMAKDMLYGTHTPGRKAPINVISRQLRHKGNNALNMTEKYLRVDNETVKEWWDDPTPDYAVDVDSA